MRESKPMPIKIVMYVEQATPIYDLRQFAQELPTMKVYMQKKYALGITFEQWKELYPFFLTDMLNRNDKRQTHEKPIKRDDDDSDHDDDGNDNNSNKKRKATHTQIRPPTPDPAEKRESNSNLPSPFYHRQSTNSTLTRASPHLAYAQLPKGQCRAPTEVVSYCTYCSQEPKAVRPYAVLLVCNTVLTSRQPIVNGNCAFLQEQKYGAGSTFFGYALANQSY